MNDKFDGGSGTDLLIFPGALTGVTVTFTSAGKGTALDGQGGTDTMLANVEGAIGTAFADVLKGSTGNDVFYGGLGNDSIDAGSGDDVVTWTEGQGNDTIEMGDGGNDTVKVVTGAGNDTITVTSSAANKVTISVNGIWTLNVTHGDVISIDTGAGDDVVTIGNLGTTDVNDIVIHFGDGNDRLNAAATATDITAYGDAGDDWFVGGSGDDDFDGGAGTDWVDYSSTPARVKVHLDGHVDEDGRGGYDDLCGIRTSRAAPSPTTSGAATART